MIGVYTALFGIYDVPRPAPYGGTLFTDQPIQPDAWNVKWVERPHPDPRYASRYYFDQSCKVMPDCEYTVMHGANSRLKVAPDELVAMLPDDVDIGVCLHPRPNAYAEAEACIRMRKDDKKVIQAQMRCYRHDGFPDDFPLSACILMIRRNTPQLAAFEAFWWNEVKNGSCRDQLSFDYCRWKLDISVYYLPNRWTQYIHVGKHVHKKNRRA